jgi:deazaflavin-dependent oxidoreductase (nitroreductase family)
MTRDPEAAIAEHVIADRRLREDLGLMTTEHDNTEHPIGGPPAGDSIPGPGGLQEQLGYRSHSPNVFQRGMQRIASTRAGAWVFQRTLYRLDRPLYRWSRGRITVPGVLAGLPVIIMTTTGARSGEPRSMPLAGIPFGADLAVIGSNYGQPRTPAWVVNLEADPHATVRWRDRSADVRARAATDDEAERIWVLATEVYAGFRAYRQRITGRRIRIFVLHPASANGEPPPTATE